MGGPVRDGSASEGGPRRAGTRRFGGRRSAGTAGRARSPATRAGDRARRVAPSPFADRPSARGDPRGRASRSRAVAMTASWSGRELPVRDALLQSTVEKTGKDLDESAVPLLAASRG